MEIDEGIDIVLRIAVCDNDLIFASRAETLLINIIKKKLINAVVEVYSDSCELLNDMTNTDKTYDIVYMDIEIYHFSGIDTARKIKEKYSDTIIIYISEHVADMQQLFEVGAFRFIKKPIDEDIFEKYFDNAYEKILQDEGYFEFKFNKVPYRILLRNIIYFESDGRMVYINHINGTGQFYKKLNDIEQELLNSKISFLRIHQSFLINYRFVSSISYSCVKMFDGTILKISEDRRKKVIKEYNALTQI